MGRLCLKNGGRAKGLEIATYLKTVLGVNKGITHVANFCSSNTSFLYQLTFLEIKRL